MTTETQKPSSLLYSCSICLKWISASAAIILEDGKNYIKHFCGKECHDKWHTEQKETEEKTEEVV